MLPTNIEEPVYSRARHAQVKSHKGHTTILVIQHEDTNKNQWVCLNMWEMGVSDSQDTKNLSAFILRRV